MLDAILYMLLVFACIGFAFILLFAVLLYFIILVVGAAEATVNKMFGYRD